MGVEVSSTIGFGCSFMGWAVQSIGALLLLIFFDDFLAAASSLVVSWTTLSFPGDLGSFDRSRDGEHVGTRRLMGAVNAFTKHTRKNARSKSSRETERHFFIFSNNNPKQSTELWVWSMEREQEDEGRKDPALNTIYTTAIKRTQTTQASHQPISRLAQTLCENSLGLPLHSH